MLLKEIEEKLLTSTPSVQHKDESENKSEGRRGLLSRSLFRHRTTQGPSTASARMKKAVHDHDIEAMDTESTRIIAEVIPAVMAYVKGKGEQGKGKLAR